MRTAIALIFVALCSPALAQQPASQPVSPSEYAVQLQQSLNQVGLGVGQLATLAEQQRKQIDALTRELADAKKQVADLKAKEPKVPEQKH